METFTFRPATRENTPLIVGVAGPTKAGKTYSALRLATGLANGGVVAMINTEGPRGHQYADEFKYVACDLDAPYRATRYIDAVAAAAKLNPAVLIIDSVSHMHDGPGGTLEWHEEELDRMVGDDHKRRERATFAAWVKPKAAENAFIYAMLGLSCPVILAMRAKEKMKIVKGEQPQDLGWQPIVGERIAFETIFTLTLPPYSKGIPNLAISQMRKPFDRLVPSDRQIDEALGKALYDWARGTANDGDALKAKGEEMARMGTAVLEKWWAALTNAQRKLLLPIKNDLKLAAEAADKQPPQQSLLQGECGCPDAPNGVHEPECPRAA